MDIELFVTNHENKQHTLKSTSRSQLSMHNYDPENELEGDLEGNLEGNIYL